MVNSNFRNTHGKLMATSNRYLGYEAMRVALEIMPKDFEKVCFHLDLMPVVNGMASLIPRWAENKYRSVNDPNRVISNHRTIKAIYELMNSYSDVKFRFQYTPSGCKVLCMDEALRLSRIAYSDRSTHPKKYDWKKKTSKM